MGMYIPYYPFLEEDKPPENPQIELVALGIWLRIDRPISQLFPENYLQEIEQRLMKLGRLGWKAFNETMGKPEGVYIRCVRGHPVGSLILAYLKSVAHDDSDISTEELHRALQSRKLQKEMCAWLNERELQRITDRIPELERECDHPLGKKRYDFNIICRSIFRDWFLSKDLPVPHLTASSTPKTAAARFRALLEEAMAAGPQTDEELWKWKERFEPYPKSYFDRHAYNMDSYKDGLDSGNGLEWRRNDKFRKPRSKKA